MTAPITTSDLLRSHLDNQERVGWHLDWPEALAALRVLADQHLPEVADGGEQYCPTCLDTAGDYAPAPCTVLSALVRELLLRPYAARLRNDVGPSVTVQQVMQLADAWQDTSWDISDDEALTVVALVAEANGAAG